MHNKTCTLEGVICTVCYCTGIIKNRLKTFLFWLPRCGRQPLVALCPLLMKMQCQESAVTTVSSMMKISCFVPLGYWVIQECAYVATQYP